MRIYIHICNAFNLHLPRAARRTPAQRATRARLRREAGSSATELLVLTAPLCVLSLVLTSKLAATSSVKLRAGAQASLTTQRAATQPCGSNPTLNAPLHPEAAPNMMAAVGPVISAGGLDQVFSTGMGLTPGGSAVPAHLTPVVEQANSFWLSRRTTVMLPPDPSKQAALLLLSQAGAPMSSLMGEALPLLQASSALRADLLTSPELLTANWAIENGSAQVVPYHFQRQADALIPGPDTLTATATFLCNEPDNGDQILREPKRQRLLSLSVSEAMGIFP